MRRRGVYGVNGVYPLGANQNAPLLLATLFLVVGASCPCPHFWIVSDASPHSKQICAVGGEVKSPPAWH